MNCFVIFPCSEPNYNGVDQWGAMFGTYIDSSIQAEDKELYLRGIRQRRWGQNNSSTLHRWVSNLLGERLEIMNCRGMQEIGHHWNVPRRQLFLPERHERFVSVDARGVGTFVSP